jgi:hypothetical protein
MARKKISTTIYITPEQNEMLKLLNQKTKVPVAEYIRQGIDLVLERQGESPGRDVRRIVPALPMKVLVTGGAAHLARTDALPRAARVIVR